MHNLTLANMNHQELADKIAEDVFHDYYHKSAGELIITEDELSRCIRDGIIPLQRRCDSLRISLRAIFEATDPYADGAPDATAHDKLCNEISALAREALSKQQHQL